MPLLAEPLELMVPLDANSDVPLYRQVYTGVRDAITSGRLDRDARLPSTRRLANSLAVSRFTVLAAFELLVAEGFVVGVVGSGSRVASELPLRRYQLSGPKKASPEPTTEPRLAARVARLSPLPHEPLLYPGPFFNGLPPIDQFPRAAWSRLTTRHHRHARLDQLYHGRAAGYRPLCDAIASHLAASRGVRCTGEEVFVLSSAQEAMDLISRVLLDPGDAVWLEEPGWIGARGAFSNADATLVPVQVDHEGLDVAAGVCAAPDARLAYVTPSYQFPIGVTLTLERRLALLEHARRSGMWILEDDYDSEFRYDGPPLAALQGLDDADRVLYTGTFNKTMFPGLRLAFLVVPPALVAPFTRMRRVGGQHAPTITQAVMAEFIATGQYARHLHRIRSACRVRRDALLASAARHLPGVLEFVDVESGLHAVGWLPLGIEDAEVCAAARQVGIEATALSSFAMGALPRGGLVLGYGALTPAVIDASMALLARAITPIVVR